MVKLEPSIHNNNNNNNLEFKSCLVINHICSDILLN